MKVNVKNNTEKEALIDPMVIDDDATFAQKKKDWEMIFLMCPEQADILIAEFREKGPEMGKAKISISYENTSETPA